MKTTSKNQMKEQVKEYLQQLPNNAQTAEDEIIKDFVSEMYINAKMKLDSFVKVQAILCTLDEKVAEAFYTVMIGYLLAHPNSTEEELIRDICRDIVSSK